MSKTFKILFFTLIFSFFLFFRPTEVAAVRFDLLPPSGPFSRGQEVDIGVFINTEDEEMANAQVDLSFKNDFLEFVGVVTGGFFPVVEKVQTGANTLRIVGQTESGGSPKKGSGLFATLTFKITADSPNETVFCTIINQTPTKSPTSTIPTSTVPTSSQPTDELPPTGGRENLLILGFLGLLFSFSGVVLKNLAKRY